ncbi:hypothetical protein OF83DRAFT_691072 [Amylostereum chailletii]|nr:hypothetical protein OF83DRAFT_691072 [Amylostereum chailletii]
MAAPAQQPRLLRIPPEILENIAYELGRGGDDDAHDHPPACPPAQLLPLLSTCRHIYNALSYTRNNTLYMRLFTDLFDADAPRRRLGPEVLHAANLASQLRTNCLTLKRIRQGDIHAPTVLADFWTLLFMALEDDGKNRVHFARAGVGAFVDRFVRTRLREGLQSGWPVESTINTLALWLLWLTLNRDMLAAQSSDRRQELVDSVLPYTVVAFKYPSFLAPDNHYHFPLADSFQLSAQTTLQNAHGAYPLYRPPTPHTHTHYQQSITFCPPPLSAAAKLVYFAVREAVPLVVPDHLPTERVPGYGGQTQTDIREVNAHRGALPRPVPRSSARFDAEWARMRRCVDPWAPSALAPRGDVYRPGCMSGLWQGKLLIPELNGYLALLTTLECPQGFSEMNPWMSIWPMFMRLREHASPSSANQRAAAVGGPSDDIRDEGIRNAWFPTVTVHHERDGVVIVDDAGNRTEHKTVRPPNPADYEADFAYAGLAASDSDGLQDIVFTGETDTDHGLAWGRYTFLGRVRAWDGLIALVRIPADPQVRAARWVFRGYLHGGTVFAGSWRAMTMNVGEVPWEGAFVVSRRA